MKVLGINHATINTNSITEIQDDSDCYLRGLMRGARCSNVPFRVGPPFTSPLHSPLQNLSLGE